MKQQTNHKLITIIIPGHKSMEILKSLKGDKSIIRANKLNARGMSQASHKSIEEMEVINIVVSEEKAQEIFIYLYEKIELYKPHNGIIFQQNLKYTTQYNLDLKNEDEI